MSNNIILSLNGIHKSYKDLGGEALHVLNDVSLDVEAGKMLAIVGQSGSGKSTLMHIAGLLDTPDNGEILLQGLNYAGASDATRSMARRELLGFVYQQHHLLPDFTALENVLMPLRIQGQISKQSVDGAKEILSQLKLSERINHLPSQLSGGEQQRVAIARAMVHKPKVLLADEPTGNLDPHTADDVFNMFKDLCKNTGVTLVMVTHNPELANRCDLQYAMLEGCLTAS